MYDVLREGASLVSNFRSQFIRFRRTSSFPELFERLRHNEAPVRMVED